MKPFYITCCILGLCPAFALAQDVSGFVTDDQGKPLAKASVALQKQKDSSVVKLAITSAKGEFTLHSIPAGRYFITSSFVGYSDGSSAAFETSGESTSVPALMLYKSSSNLKEVTVTATKPVVEVKADKMILNVEGTINAVGQDALELLRKSPGVLVDRDDNLSLSGKNGVQVYIDGKPTPLSGKDLSDYLKSIQSAAIEAIEIITNPSAKYDAAGNAGIINIRLRKNRSFGTNGSINTDYGVGVYPKYNAGLSLNHRNSKMNVFGTYNYHTRKYENFMSIYRLQLDTAFDQHATMWGKGHGHNVKAGMDYFLSSKHTIGVMATGNFTANEFNNLSNTKIVYDPSDAFIKTLIADNTSKSERDQLNININYRYADTSGRQFNIDADYGTFTLRNDQLQPNFYFDPLGDPLDTRIYNMLSPSDIDIYTLKADYEQNYKKGKLSFGGKISYVQSLNDFRRFNIEGSVKDLDRERSNDFNYRENINAAYVNFNRPFKKFSVQVGLRAEQTTAKGASHGMKRYGSEFSSYDSSFRREYTNLFPSAALSFTRGKNHQFNITFSRRIDRPAYQDLNPFEFKLDEYTYQKGNTALRPQYTSSFGLSHTYKYKLTTALNYSHVADVFTQLIDTAERSKAFITRKNLATQDIVSLNVSYPLQIKWYGSFVNFNTYYSHFKADLGVGRTIDLDVFAYNMYVQQTARLGHGWTAELSGWYSSPSIWQGTFKSKEMWSLDAGLQKAVLKGKGNIKTSVSDIFQTMRWGGTSNFAGQYLYNTGGWESRQFKLSLTYRFGSTQVKAARQRKTGLEDESQRVSTDNGTR